MKNTTNTVIKKLLLSIILVIMLGNFVMPTRVQAKITGGDLAQPVMQFVAWLGDMVVEFLQKNVGNGGDITDMDGNYAIKYTLGNIFANEIALLDVNFVSPNEYEVSNEEGWTLINDVKLEDIRI